MTFSVSVIIPVFNAEKYLRKAVESALQFECVKEVILVEDKSPDDALKLCKVLTEEDHRVKLYQHPNGENRGAGASRNLGIEMATSPYIAFLDADDWYLPNRFDAEQTVFRDSTIDGVYGATGIYYEDRGELDIKMYTLPKGIASSDLLFQMNEPDVGEFSTNSITLKRAMLLRQTKLFDTRLKLHQDSHFWNILAHRGKLINGIVDTPVSIARLHGQNRITGRNEESLRLYFTILMADFIEEVGVDKRFFRRLLKNYIIYHSKSSNNLLRLLFLIKTLVRKPNLIIKIF